LLNPKIRKALDWFVGSALILLGIVGGLVPVLQGWIFILAGLAVLSSHSRWARELLRRFQQLGRSVRQSVWSRRADSDNGDPSDEK